VPLNIRFEVIEETALDGIGGIPASTGALEMQ
jgi:hypothetical protein